MRRLPAAACAVLALLFSGIAFAAPKKVHVAAGVDAPEEEADRYLNANLELVQKKVPEAIHLCAKGADPTLLKDFEFALEVGKGGKAGKSVATPANPFTTCVAHAVGSMKFTEPEHSPLGVYFEVAIRD